MLKLVDPPFGATVTVLFGETLNAFPETEALEIVTVVTPLLVTIKFTMLFIPDVVAGKGIVEPSAAATGVASGPL